MGFRGDKEKAEAALTAELFLSRLSVFENVSSKKMFGGYGIFHEGQMFGMVDSSGSAFLKADGSTIEEFEKIGAKKHGKMPYFEIPDEVFENRELLTDWSIRAMKIT
ncbi:MAG: TfoX/Sxy family protein [Cyclobacteriaceae bacterium]